MFEGKYKELNAVEKQLFEQVAANPAYEKLLCLEKEDLEYQILNFYRMEKETDQSFCRRLEKLHHVYSITKELLSLNKEILS